MIKIAILEDDKADQALLTNYIDSYKKSTGAEISISVFDDGILFLEAYTQSYDIVFLDIEVHSLNGMKVAEKLRKIDNNVLIIFTTNLSNYAVKGYSVDAIHFLVKPIAYAAFLSAMDKATNIIRRRNNNDIFLPLESGQRRIALKDIFYCEVMDHYMFFHTSFGCLKIYMPMRDAEKLLLVPGKDFIKIHRSYLVNPAYIQEVTASSVVMSPSGIELPLSRDKKKEVLQQLLAFTYGGGVSE
jgi:DNA-binding LytR/AlgR family response regulator